MAKINISIPDATMKDLQELGRKINKSRVCAEALKQAVKIEHAKKEGTFMDASREEYYQKQGLSLALLAMRNDALSYEAIAETAKMVEEQDGIPLTYDQAKKFFLSEIEEIELWDSYVEDEINESKLPKNAIDLFVQGFINGIADLF